MQKYIEQIIENIKQIMDNSDKVSLEDLFVLKYFDLPSVEKLNDEQAELLGNAIEYAFNEFGVGIDIDENSTFKDKYYALRLFFAETDEDYEDIKLNGENRN